METTEELLKKIVSLLENQELKPALGEALREDLNSYLERAKREKDFHKRLNEDMLSGLHNIYKEITQVAAVGKGQGEPQNTADATAIFHEASRQLEEIMQSTLEAADSIMTNAEKVQNNQTAVAALLPALESGEAAPAVVRKLGALLQDNMGAMNEIVLALSFQDLTGQRIKKVVSALGSIHQIVVETYVSAGLMLKKSEEAPDKDFESISKESKEQALSAAVTGSELKGPSSNAASQQDVDDLLAQLGF